MTLVIVFYLSSRKETRAPRERRSFQQILESYGRMCCSGRSSPNLEELDKDSDSSENILKKCYVARPLAKMVIRVELMGQ